MAKLAWRKDGDGKYHAKSLRWPVDYYIHRKRSRWYLTEFGTVWEDIDHFPTLLRARAGAAYREGRPKPERTNY